MVYRQGKLVGNLVALRDELGEDFFSEDVENLLNMYVTFISILVIIT